jgi:predicted PhzF superfamily epimerase YddE/YHI9
MPTLHVLRVFVNDEGELGNPLGVFLDGDEVPGSRRQGIAAALGFSETAFVDDRRAGALRIFTPEVELPFAGHPAVGVAWLLARGGRGSPKALRPPAGEVAVRQANGGAFVAADPRWAPPFDYRQLGSPAEVKALRPEAADANTYAWSWIDADAGTIRARSFVPEAGIAEDEATGSAALALCAQLGRPLTIHQGRGSVLLCRPLPGRRAEVGGRVVLDRIDEHPLDPHA